MQAACLPWVVVLYVLLLFQILMGRDHDCHCIKYVPGAASWIIHFRTQDPASVSSVPPLDIKNRHDLKKHPDISNNQCFAWTAKRSKQSSGPMTGYSKHCKRQSGRLTHFLWLHRTHSIWTFTTDCVATLHFMKMQTESNVLVTDLWLHSKQSQGKGHERCCAHSPQNSFCIKASAHRSRCAKRSSLWCHVKPFSTQSGFTNGNAVFFHFIACIMGVWTRTHFGQLYHNVLRSLHIS